MDMTNSFYLTGYLLNKSSLNEQTQVVKLTLSATIKNKPCSFFLQATGDVAQRLLQLNKDDTIMVNFKVAEVKQATTWKTELTVLDFQLLKAVTVIKTEANKPAPKKSAKQLDSADSTIDQAQKQQMIDDVILNQFL